MSRNYDAWRTAEPESDDTEAAFDHVWALLTKSLEGGSRLTEDDRALWDIELTFDDATFIGPNELEITVGYRKTVDLPATCDIVPHRPVINTFLTGWVHTLFENRLELAQHEVRIASNKIVITGEYAFLTEFYEDYGLPGKDEATVARWRELARDVGDGVLDGLAPFLTHVYAIQHFHRLLRDVPAYEAYYEAVVTQANRLRNRYGVA